ncbi:MAG TPA: hypothetical protein PK718_07535 [Candidatus Methanofastidiosa archaeon]|nr:hypothetical protein [Candidatus Methanofastidiosa archaeon]
MNKKIFLALAILMLLISPTMVACGSYGQGSVNDGCHDNGNHYGHYINNNGHHYGHFNDVGINDVPIPEEPTITLTGFYWGD